MDLKTLKIYDLDAHLRNECDLEAFRYKKVAVFEGKSGIVVAEQEAVHQKGKTLSDEICIQANTPARPGKSWLMPAYEVRLPISDILSAPSEEMTMDAFFSRRSYNPRCQANWNCLLRSLSDIGFDLRGYMPEKAPLEKVITSAEKQKPEPSAVGKQAPAHER